VHLITIQKSVIQSSQSFKPLFPIPVIYYSYTISWLDQTYRIYNSHTLFHSIHLPFVQQSYISDRSGILSGPISKLYPLVMRSFWHSM